MITNIKLEYEDSDIELTLDEAKELYKELHELFGKDRGVPDFYRPSGPSCTQTTTPYSLQDGLLQSPQTGAPTRCDHVSPARVAGATAGKGSKGKK